MGILDPGKGKFADAASATAVDFDPNQVDLTAQPVDAANAIFPASRLSGAALTVRPRNPLLRITSVAQGFPLLRSDLGKERSVDRMEYVKIRNRTRRDRKVPAEVFCFLLLRATFYDDNPRELVRTEQKLIVRCGWWFRSRLGKSMRRDRGASGVINNGLS